MNRIEHQNAGPAPKKHPEKKTLDEAKVSI